MTRQAGNAERDERVLESLPLVRGMAAGLLAALPAHAVEFDDLCSAGVMGLCEAATHYAPSRKVDFATYSKYRIRGAMLDYLRRLDWAGRDARRAAKRLASSIAELEADLSRAPSEEELVAHTGLSLESLRELRRLLSIRPKHELDRDADGIPADYKGRDEWRPDTLAQAAEMKTLLRQAMSRLPPRNRKIMLLYYSDSEMTMQEIGVRMNVNESRISQIHKRSLQLLQEYFAGLGIDSSSVLSAAA